MMKTFDKLTAPLKTFLDHQGKQIDAESGSRSFFFNDFVLKMVYGITLKVGSLRLLLTELESPRARELGFLPTAYSTFREGFSRFAVPQFRKMFLHVLESHEWLRLEALDELDIVKLVDGSLFPTLSSMCWATYKKNKNALRLHLELDLNTLIPTEFLVQQANSCERSFLLSILKQGVTYIADRGYFSFKVGHAIIKENAFFIIRIKENLKRSTLSEQPVTGKCVPACFNNLTDSTVRFDSDPHEHTYRLVCFEVLQSRFLICTNRFELTTLQIIMLYAYRWQIELVFKFLKRTLNGIHLFSQSSDGASVHFYLLLTIALLQLALKQDCQRKAKLLLEQKQQFENLSSYVGNSPDEWIRKINQCFEKHWKISVHWLKSIEGRIASLWDEETVLILASQ